MKKSVYGIVLIAVMAALGADTTIDKFRQAGAKPFALAGTLYAWLLIGGCLLSTLVTSLFS